MTTTHELDILLEQIAKSLDVYEFLDLMEWTMNDLVQFCREEVAANIAIFEEALS